MTGGVLTAAGLGGPIGPALIASTMAVAAATAHRGKGAFAATGGPELPLTNLAAAAAIATAGPGRYSVDELLRVHIPEWLIRLVVVGSAVVGAVTAIEGVVAQESDDASTDEAEIDLRSDPSEAASVADSA